MSRKPTNDTAKATADTAVGGARLDSEPAPTLHDQGDVRAQRLLELLNLEPIEENLMRGQNELPWTNVEQSEGKNARLFGGQVLAQSLQAAYATVEERAMHSLHGYFLRAGSAARPVLYEVDRIRDGRSFTTRRVVAIQNGQAIFSMSASFQKAESGFTHAASMPNVPLPEELDDDVDVAQLVETQNPSLAGRLAPNAWRARPFLTRSVYPLGSDEWLQPRRWNPVWIKFRRAGEPLADGSTSNERLRHLLLAYASDMGMVSTAGLPSRADPQWQNLQMASLDHALWLHQPEYDDDWLLVNKHTTIASGGRGLNHAEVFTRSGELIASVTQEGLLRGARGEPA